MSGETLAVTLLAMFGVGLCVGLLVGPLFDWWYHRKSSRAHEAWALKHHRLTEDQFLRLVNERRD